MSWLKKKNNSGILTGKLTLSQPNPGHLIMVMHSNIVEYCIFIMTIKKWISIVLRLLRHYSFILALIL